MLRAATWVVARLLLLALTYVLIVILAPLALVAARTRFGHVGDIDLTEHTAELATIE